MTMNLEKSRLTSYDRLQPFEEIVGTLKGVSQEDEGLLVEVNDARLLILGSVDRELLEENVGQEVALIRTTDGQIVCQTQS
ncbi:hypothetical protein OB955_00175 [Halobacteria archaeon AArc-m2/3/4]|uniref:Uncharacterized protein n=1 Tax=Natronoglomus mannanivorans TaxID=2979990 RepID=A0ABT2Q8A6_9EURY|nr:hypothetical protein [Halobacteria archaeon AArc-m2/3/4]